jgi:hypothetical protein
MWDVLPPVYVLFASAVPLMWAATWMCVARPLYQPGKVVMIWVMPSSSVGWMPRRKVVPRVPSASTPE